MAVEMDEDAGLMPPPARTQDPVAVRARISDSKCQPNTIQLCAPSERIPRRTMENGAAGEREDGGRDGGQRVDAATSPHAQGEVVGCGGGMDGGDKSRDPIMLCAIRGDWS